MIKQYKKEMFKLNAKTINVVQVGKNDSAPLIGRSLKQLRELSGISQRELADRLNVARSTIYRIEQQADPRLSTLESYISALGAALRIEAALSAEQLNLPRADQFLGEFGTDDNQLVFSLFEQKNFEYQRDVVLSIRPSYSNKILSGKKTVELRRRFPVAAPHGTLAYIYSTSPIQAIVACASISKIHKLPLDQLWKNFRQSASITKSNFYDYFQGLENGFAIEFSCVHPLSRPLPLEELRERFSFAPPQSFLYATPMLKRAIRYECAELPH